MKIGTIQSLACVGLGELLGLVAATRGIAPPARAYEALPGPRQVVKEAQATATQANQPVSCSEEATRNSLVALANAEKSATGSQPNASAKKPNILVIWGDDIGIHNISAYNHGIMGYKRPTSTASPRKARCLPTSMPSRAARPGVPPSSSGSIRFARDCSRSACLVRRMASPRTPTIADLLKVQGYATGQFGKNHLGDNNKHLPTVHGFDEFFGNLYHLNAEEEPEGYYYPKNPEFKKKYGPRGVLHCMAVMTRPQGLEAEDRRHGSADHRAHADNRPGDLRAATTSSIAPSSKNKPFFVWFNATRMHVWTHLKKESRRTDRHRPLARRHGRARRHGGRIAEEDR